MPRKIFITEEMADKLQKMSELPDSLSQILDAHETTFGENDCFPPKDGSSFEYRLATARYQELQDELGSDVLTLPVEEKKNLLSKIVSRCQEIEENNVQALEKLCFNIVNRMFSIPNGAITFKCHLQKDVKKYERDIRAKAEDTPSMEYDSIQEMNDLKDEVTKRMILNAITVGVGLTYSKIPKRFIGDLYEIDRELPGLYADFSALDSLLLFEDKLPEITEQNKSQGGMVFVKVGGVGERTLVEAYGTVFPIMLCESIKGFMELFSSHGLPRKKEAAEYVMKKTDFAQAEVWDSILGPGMWGVLSETLGDLDMKYFPLLFTRLSEMPGTEFIPFMQEVFANTRKGKEEMSDFVESVIEELEYEDFEDGLAMKNVNKNMISEYFSPEELDTL